MNNVCTNAPNINIFDIELFFTIKLISNIKLKVTYDKIFFFFLSFVLIIGKFSVSAGAYNVIIIIPNTSTNPINIYLCIGCRVINLLAKTTP